MTRPTLRRATLRQALLAGGAVLALGVLLGALWWVAAPLARVDVVGGQAYLAGNDELQVAQDGWFAVVTGLAGVLAATVLSLRPGRFAAASAAVAPALALAVALVAWRVGVLLGPPSLADQVGSGSLTPLTPLGLHAYGVLLVGPFLLTVTRFLAALFSSNVLPNEGRPAAAPGRSPARTAAHRAE